jgi:hypothetical protein
MWTGRRILVRTHWNAERRMKAGRGHVCKINPFIYRHVAIGPRSLLPADGSDSLAITFFCPVLCLRHDVLKSLLITLFSKFQAALARVSALLAAQKEPKAAPPRKVRGRKAKKVAEATE